MKLPVIRAKKNVFTSFEQIDLSYRAHARLHSWSAADAKNQCKNKTQLLPNYFPAIIRMHLLYHIRIDEAYFGEYFVVVEIQHGFVVDDSNQI